MALLADCLTYPFRRIATIQQTAQFANRIEMHRLSLKPSNIESSLSVLRHLTQSERKPTRKIRNLYFGSNLLFPIFLSNYLCLKLTMAASNTWMEKWYLHYVVFAASSLI